MKTLTKKEIEKHLKNKKVIKFVSSRFCSYLLFDNGVKLYFWKNGAGFDWEQIKSIGLKQQPRGRNERV